MKKRSWAPWFGSGHAPVAIVAVAFGDALVIAAQVSNFGMPKSLVVPLLLSVPIATVAGILSLPIWFGLRRLLYGPGDDWSSS